jgi:murein DD-endopeptidase MepM/ murein hydrolase activator NlpD
MRKRVLIIIVLFFTAFSVFLWRLARLKPRNHEVVALKSDPFVNPTALPQASPSATSVEPALPSPAASPNPTPSASVPAEAPSPTPQAAPTNSPGKLLIPVAGIRPEQLQDTFTAARAEGRTHDAIDIPAPKDTPVLAAANGTVIKLFLSKPGGITIYQLDPDNRTVYYYAHLDHYADGLEVGKVLHRGDTIAYVGDTGNAGPGNYHLHFSVSIVSDPKRYWEGTNINPYPLLIQP